MKIKALILGRDALKVVAIDDIVDRIENNAYYLYDYFGDDDHGRYAVYFQGGIPEKVMIRALALNSIWGLK